MGFLQTTTGPTTGAWHPLGPKTVLGRHPDCNVVIDVGAVSRYHAQILQENGQFLIEDLNSRNHTFLNDQVVQGRIPLKNGDVVRICDVGFTFYPAKPAEGKTTTALVQPVLDESGFATILVDDDARQVSSTIMSKLDVSTSRGRVLMAASPEVKLGAMIEITSSLGKALSLDSVLPQVLKSLFKVFVQADRGFIVMSGPDGRLIPKWTKLRREDSDESIRISKTICRQVMETKEAILSADAASDSRFEMSQSIADFRIRSMMCAPLVNSDGQAFGVLQVDTLDQRNKFRAEDLEVLAAVAAQASIAIDNAQLHEQALQRREIERDLQLSRQVQRGFLPHDKPRIPGYEFYDFYQPANHVGGDYFDYILLPDGRLAVIVADVVGHGIAAALLMAKLSAEARFSLASLKEPKMAVCRLNDALCRAGVEDRFVTFIVTILNPANHQVTIVNAGHMAPIVRRSNGRVEEAAESIAGLPLGIVDGFDYEQATIQLGPSEWLALYTDGINEATDRTKEQYSIERIRSKILAASDGPQALGKRLVEDVMHFLNGEPQGDDMCLVCFGRESTWGRESVFDGEQVEKGLRASSVVSQTAIR